jgi:hypothetical protein
MRTTLEEGRRVVLTANPTFGRGPRGELCQWLLKERQALAR